jgi:hypothetical protein
MFRRMMLAVLVVGLMASGASAGLSLNYDGSFDLPSAAAWGDYYYGKLAFIPEDTPRPDYGSALTEATLVAQTTHLGRTREFNALPTPSTNSGSVPVATLLSNASGGTEYSGGGPSCVDSAGNFWTGIVSGSGGPVGLLSAPDDSNGGTEDHTLSNDNSGSPAVQETGWYSGPGGTNYRNGGVLRKSDGNGSALPVDGTQNGAVFLTSGHLSSGVPGYKIYVGQNTRTSATTVTSQPLFNAYQNDFADGARPVEYVKTTTGEEYFLMWKAGAHAGDSFMLDFYDGTISDGADHDPTVSLDIGPAILAGAGWLDGTGTSSQISQIKFMSFDWATSTLYVLDGGINASSRNREARIHVFTLEFETPPVAEPAGLSLIGLALVGIRKKRS